jgi:hypothetical protein
MKLKIEAITQKERTTARGPAISISILSNKVWYSGWLGDWNKGWKRGDVIDVDVIDRPGQNGVIFHNIQTPKKEIPKAVTDDADEIKNMLTQIMHELLEIKKIVSPSEPSQETTNETSPF